jgi:hypothetical protein
MDTIEPPIDFGVESIDAEGNVTHYPTMKLAVAAGFDKRNILNCLAGKRDKHKGRQWRPATWTSAIPGFVARWMTNKVDEVPVTDERPLAKFEVNHCQVDHKYRGWLWQAGISVRNAWALPIHRSYSSRFGRRVSQNRPNRRWRCHENRWRCHEMVALGVARVRKWSLLDGACRAYAVAMTLSDAANFQKL